MDAARGGEILPLLRELGIGLVPYSPLGRGFLTGTIASAEDLGAGDFRRHNPRFTGDALAANLALVDAVRELAAGKGVTAGQLALAWVLAQGDDVVPIPGTKRVRYLEENVGAAAITLTGEDLAALAAAVPIDAVRASATRTCPASTPEGANGRPPTLEGMRTIAPPPLPSPP